MPYLWVLLASAGVSAALGGYGWRRRSVPGAVPFVLLMLAAAAWSLANGLELACLDLTTKLFWANVQYTIGVIGPVAYLALVLEYTGREEWLTPRNLALLAIEPVITILLVWTDSSHGLIRRNVYLDTAGPFPVVGKTYGPWFWVHTGYSYLLTGVAIFLLLATIRFIPRFYRGQPLMILIGLLVPMAANSLYVLGYSPFPRHDVAPALLTLSGFAMAWGIFRYRWLDLMPVARHTVVENMRDGVIVLDAQQRVVDLNPAAQQILRQPASQIIGLSVGQAFVGWPVLLRICCSQNAVHEEMRLDRGETLQYYEVTSSLLTDRRGQTIGYLVVLHDITERKRNLNRLLAQQQHMAVLEDRERLARELHDGLAQDLAALRLRISRWQRLLYQNPDRLYAELDATRDLLSASIRDVRRAIFALRPVALEELGFLPALRQFAEEFGEQNQVVVDLKTSGTADHLSPAAEVTLFRIVQEALHNVGKHAQAGMVWIHLDLSSGRSASLHIRDDGLGFDPASLPEAVRRGHVGLTQMQARVEKLGGTFLLSSQPGHGTEIRVTLPTTDL